MGKHNRRRHRDRGGVDKFKHETPEERHARHAKDAARCDRSGRSLATSTALHGKFADTVILNALAGNANITNPPPPRGWADLATFDDRPHLRVIDWQGTR